MSANTDIETDAIPDEQQERDQWLTWDAAADAPRRPHWRGDFSVSWTDRDDLFSESETGVRFPEFHTMIRSPGNQEPTDCAGRFPDFTDFTPTRKGVYVTPAPTRAPTRPHRYSSLPIRRCEIREMCETARWKGGENGLLCPLGVKSGKSRTFGDSGVTK